MPRTPGSSTPTSTRPRSARTSPSRCPIVGDAKNVLQGLTRLVPNVDPATRADYLAQLAEWRIESEGSSWHGSGGWQSGVLSADFVVERIGELTDHVATYVADVGQNQMWLARYTRFRRPHSHISSGGLGTMGFAVPAAMGAALGNPDAETWAICGDGGFQMTSQELMTLAADRIPVKIAILDNKKLGMIRQWQELFYAGNYHSSHLPGPDFVKLADAYGIPAFKVTATEDVDGAIRSAQAVDGPALIWFETDRGAECVPDHACGQGSVRPDRDLGGVGGMSPDPVAPSRPWRPARRPRPHRAPPSAAILPGTGEAGRHILVVLVMDRPGVLNRVASLMRARNFNIDSLAVSRTDKAHISRMTLTLHGDDVARGAGRQAALPADRRAQGPGRHRGPGGRARARAPQGPRDRRQPGRGDQDRRALQGPDRGHRARTPSSSRRAARRPRSTRSSRWCAATESRNLSGPARSSCCAAPGPSRRHSEL